MEEKKLVLNYTTSEGMTETLHYCKALSYEGMCEACEFIAGSVIDKDGIYRPYKLGVAQKFVAIYYFTDVTSGFDIEESDEQRAVVTAKVFDMIDHTDIFNSLMKKISLECWAEIVAYSDKMIEYRKTIRPVDRTAQRFDKLLEVLAQKVLDVNVDELLEKLASMVETFGEADGHSVTKDAKQ